MEDSKINREIISKTGYLLATLCVSLLTRDLVKQALA